MLDACFWTDATLPKTLLIIFKWKIFKIKFAILLPIYFPSTHNKHKFPFNFSSILHHISLYLNVYSKLFSFPSLQCRCKIILDSFRGIFHINMILLSFFLHTPRQLKIPHSQYTYSFHSLHLLLTLVFTSSTSAFFHEEFPSRSWLCVVRVYLHKFFFPARCTLKKIFHFFDLLFIYFNVMLM